jgi:hypothetical protein
MKKAGTMFIKNLRYLYLVGVIAIGLMTIIGTGGGGGGSGGGDDSDSTDETPITLYSEKEITSDGGSISIIDEYNNTIEVTFPKDVLSKATQISLGVLSEQPDLPIETRYVSAFEIKPYNTELYGSVFVRVNYENAVQDINRTVLFRKKTDSLLVPLANHEHFDNKTVRAEAFFLGVFAEGKMSLDQINNQIDLLLASKEIDLDQKNATANTSPIDSICYTEISKAIWGDWKETAFGVLKYYEDAQWLGLPLDVEIWDSICTNIASAGGQMVLDRCIPEDICDHNYRYTIIDALDTIQRLACIQNNEVYTQLNNRYKDIVAQCTKDGYLDIRLSALEVRSLTIGPGTPFYSEIVFDVNGKVPLRIEVVNISGFADVMEKRKGVFDLVNTSGFVTYYPGSSFERVCQINVSGYILVEVAGSKDSSDVYTLLVVTHHYTGQTQDCPSLPTTTCPLEYTKSRIFKVILSPENDYKDTGTAEGDLEWNISAELLLP